MIPLKHQDNGKTLKHSRWQQAPCLLSLFFCLIHPRKLFKSMDTHMDTTCETLLIYCFLSTPALKCRLQQFQKKYASVQHILLTTQNWKNNSKKSQCLVTRKRHKAEKNQNPEIIPCMYEMINFLGQLHDIQCLQYGHTCVGKVILHIDL